MTFALLFYRVALFHSRSAHVRIMNVLLRGMARALQIDIGAPPLHFFLSCILHHSREFPILSLFLPHPSLSPTHAAASSSKTFTNLLVDSVLSLSPKHEQCTRAMPLEFKLELVRTLLKI